MALVQILEDSFDTKLPLPFDLYDARGNVLARKYFVVPQKVLDFRQGLGNVYVTETALHEWQKRLVGKVNELINDPSVTLSDLATTIPDQTPAPEEPYASPAQRAVRLTTGTVDDLQEMVLQAVRPPQHAVSPLLDIARQLQTVVERTGDFGLLYSHQQLRQKSHGWIGALVAQLTLLACKALPMEDTPNPLDALLRKNLLGISLLVVAGMDLDRGYAKRQGPSYAAEVQMLPHAALSRIDTAAGLLVATEQFSAAVQRLQQLYGHLFALLAEVFALCAPPVLLAKKHFDRITLDPAAPFLARIRQQYGPFLPGQFVQLANRDVGVVVGYSTVLRAPSVIRVLNASGMPFSEPLPTRPENALHRVVGGYGSEKVRCLLDYRQILERVRV